MLHEILLSLSGQPSPLLRADLSHNQNPARAAIAAPERELLATAAHLSDLIIKLQSSVAQISTNHPSTICRAVATTIETAHLAAFQRKVLEVEDGILRKESDFVGAYNIVPLTAVVGEFSEWTRRLEWLWKIVQFIIIVKQGGNKCRGAELLEMLRAELQSGYLDIEQTAMSLVAAAETAWLKQVSAWILYGRLPSRGEGDFFIKRGEGSGEFVIERSLLPKFVTPSTASSMLFIGKSLNHVRVKSNVDSGLQGLDQLSSQLRELSALTFPLEPPTLSRAITSIRLSLARRTLQKLLPLSKVVEILQLLRDYFLLGRGEFALALTQQADEKLQSRWKRADSLAYEKREGLGSFAVKEGEVTAVLAKTWASIGLMQRQHADEDEGLELARDFLRLNLTENKSDGSSPQNTVRGLAATPFCNLLLSVPVTLDMQIPSPIDMFLFPSDMQIYSAINAYLLSIRRAHIHLTDLWKITSLRRHHPAPPAPPAGSTRSGRAKVQLLRERQRMRASATRNTWVTASAAIYFLAETEAYLQTEVVAGLWDGFHTWLMLGEPPEEVSKMQPSSTVPLIKQPLEAGANGREYNRADDEDDIWLAQSTSRLNLQSPQASTASSNSKLQHDPQSIAIAHGRYLKILTHRLLLTTPAYTAPLFSLLVSIDSLVALVRRLHGIWTSMDLEADAGVVDAFVDLENEESDVLAALREAEGKVKHGLEGVIGALRALEADSGFAEGVGVEEGTEEIGEGIGVGSTTETGYGEEGVDYVPGRVGGIDRLLMKLDFGGWFGGNDRRESLGLGG